MIWDTLYLQNRQFIYQQNRQCINLQNRQIIYLQNRQCIYVQLAVADETECSVLQCRDNKQSIKISKRLTVHLTHLNIVNIWYNHIPTCFPLSFIDALLNFYISMFCIFSIYLQFLSKFGIGTA